MQRNFEPMRKQVEAWQRSELTDVTAKVVIYEAFVEGKLEVPNTLPTRCMTCTSSRGMRNSGHERSGVSPTRSLRHSRHWIPFHNSRLRRNWASSSRRGFGVFLAYGAVLATAPYPIHRRVYGKGVLHAGSREFQSRRSCHFHIRTPSMSSFGSARATARRKSAEHYN